MALLVLIAVVGIVIVAQKATAMNSSSLNLDSVYRSVAQTYGEDWRLVKTFAMKESSENPNAENPGDPSYGLFGIQPFWLVYLRLMDAGDPDKEAKAKQLLSDPIFATDAFCRILRYFRTRTNPQTMEGFKFPEESDIYNVGETKWSKGIRNVEYRDFIIRTYQELTQALDA